MSQGKKLSRNIVLYWHIISITSAQVSMHTDFTLHVGILGILMFSAMEQENVESSSTLN